MPSLGLHRDNQLGVAEDHEVRAVGRDQDLTMLLGGLKVVDDRAGDVLAVEMVLRLIENERIAALRAEQEAQEHGPLLAGRQAVERMGFALTPPLHLDAGASSRMVCIANTSSHVLGRGGGSVKNGWPLAGSMICNSAEGFDMRAAAKSWGVMAVASRSTLGRLNPHAGGWWRWLWSCQAMLT